MYVPIGTDRIVESRAAFPDYLLEHEGERILAEAEFRTSNFLHHRHDLARPQGGDAPGTRGVHEDPAGDDGRDLLDPEFARPPLLDDVAGPPAVVELVADLQVVEAVQLGPDLQRPRDELGDPVEVVPAPTAPA